MADREGHKAERREQFTETPEYSESFRHPADQSWNLQILLDLKQSMGRLDERTSHALDEVRLLRTDVRGIPSRGTFWTGIGLVVAVFIAIAAAYNAGLGAKIDALTTRVASLENHSNPIRHHNQR